MTFSEEEQALLKRRAANYAKAPLSSSQGQQRWICAEWDDQEWGFLAKAFREVLIDPAWALMPAGAKWFGYPCCAILLYRGRPRPVLAWRALLGERQIGLERQSQACLLLESSELVIAVPGPVNLVSASLHEPSGKQPEYCAGHLSTGAAAADLDRLGVAGR